jgi:hypothetical protein
MSKQAQRAFNRLASIAEAQSAEACEMDALFDGGEWSGPAHGEMLANEIERLAHMVARRFGIDPSELGGPI